MKMELSGEEKSMKERLFPNQIPTVEGEERRRRRRRRKTRAELKVRKARKTRKKLKEDVL